MQSSLYASVPRLCLAGGLSGTFPVTDQVGSGILRARRSEVNTPPMLSGQCGIILAAFPASAFPQSISSPLGGQDCLCSSASILLCLPKLTTFCFARMQPGQIPSWMELTFPPDLLDSFLRMV